MAQDSSNLDATLRKYHSAVVLDINQCLMPKAESVPAATNRSQRLGLFG
jgi:hypothetical protein